MTAYDKVRSAVNFRLSMTLQFHENTELGVFGTGCRPCRVLPRMAGGSRPPGTRHFALPNIKSLSMIYVM